MFPAIVRSLSYNCTPPNNLTLKASPHCGWTNDDETDPRRQHIFDITNANTLTRYREVLYLAIQKRGNCVVINETAACVSTKEYIEGRKLKETT